MTGTALPELEVHLEDAGRRSWLASVANVVAGNNGSAQFRFVARPPTASAHAPGPAVVGATFPVMRWQDLNDRRPPNTWGDLAEERLEELHRRLLADGWVRTGETGRHWWSRIYTRRTPERDPGQRAPG